jgi:hypothetical protein
VGFERLINIVQSANSVNRKHFCLSVVTRLPIGQQLYKTRHCWFFMTTMFMRSSRIIMIIVHCLSCFILILSFYYSLSFRFAHPPACLYVLLHVFTFFYDILWFQLCFLYIFVSSCIFFKFSGYSQECRRLPLSLKTNGWGDTQVDNRLLCRLLVFEP